MTAHVSVPMRVHYYVVCDGIFYCYSYVPSGCYFEEFKSAKAFFEDRINYILLSSIGVVGFVRIITSIQVGMV